jgi:hypothetical protein
MIKMIKVTSWRGIINLSLNQKLYYLYEYIMTLWNFNISEL